MAKEIKKVAFYGRESSKDQSDLATVETQREACFKYCARNGWEVVAEFTDGAVSGNSALEDRPGGKELVKLIETGKIDAVVGANVDRLTRSDKMADRGAIYDLLGENDTAFASPREGEIHCNDLVGDITYSIRSAVAKEELEKIRKRAKDGFATARRNNRSPGGSSRYGVNWVNLGKDHPNRGYWEVNEEELAVLKRYFDLVKKGYALETIADLFNSEGIPTKYGKKWASTALNYILKSDFYFTGILEYNDGLNVDTGIKLFTKAKVEKVRKCRKTHPATRRKTTKNGNYEPGTYLLRGIMFCECGRVMTPHKVKKGYYRCRRKGCRTGGLRMKETDHLIWKTFEDKLTDPHAIHDALAAENLIPGGDLKEAKKRIKVADGKLKLLAETKDRFTVNFARHRMTEEAYEAEMAKVEKDEIHWKNERAKAENTTYGSDVLELAAEAAAKFMEDKLEVFRLLKSVKGSLVDADLLTKLEFYPKLNEILKDLEVKLGESDLPEEVNAEV